MSIQVKILRYNYVIEGDSNLNKQKTSAIDEKILANTVPCLRLCLILPTLKV